METQINQKILAVVHQKLEKQNPALAVQILYAVVIRVQGAVRRENVQMDGIHMAIQARKAPNVKILNLKVYVLYGVINQ